jgi:hypothetical protein
MEKTTPATASIDRGDNTPRNSCHSCRKGGWQALMPPSHNKSTIRQIEDEDTVKLAWYSDNGEDNNSHSFH